MFLEFTTIEKSQEPLEEENEFFPFWKPNHYRRKFGFWEQFFYCQCGHIYYIHNFDTDRCDADYFGKCICTKLVFVEANMEITFTVADLFDLENPDYERDSLQWWSLFGEWYEKRIQRMHD